VPRAPDPRLGFPGVEGYAEQAHVLIAQYESVPFLDKHAAILHLIPGAPCRVLDVGAGTGADAAWLAGRGHQVVAVEPTRELREPGMALHASSVIEWGDDGLPDLDVITRSGRTFDRIMLTAVWMHLDERERRRAMPVLAKLLAPRGVVLFALRHGPIPTGRRMFDVGPDETIELARAHGLESVLRVHTASLLTANRAAGVEWTRLALASV
jgi:SAM-dependent methyltransferase